MAVTALRNPRENGEWRMPLTPNGVSYKSANRGKAEDYY
jgi:hypothetical protein